jgi:glycosyltransferase involved in cell wall biosynthesis
MAIEKAIRRSQISPLLRHRPDAVFVGSVAEKEMTALYPFRSRTVIPHGVSAAFLKADPQGPRHDHFVWASQKQRGLAQTLEAWKSHVAPQARDASFHVFGTRAGEMNLTDDEARLNRIVFHGSKRKDELAAFYASAKAMIYPGAPDETFCMAAAEAQAVGLPVITLGIGSLSERVQNGLNGFVCKNFREMAHHACRLMQDEELWRLLHEGALATAGLLTWERSAKLWEGLMTSAPPAG